MITQFKIFEGIERKKINFQWIDNDGKIYKFRNITVYNSYVPMMGVSQVIRQYIKQKWNIKFQIKSQSYSGGSSIIVYLNPMDISKKLMVEIENDLDDKFQCGHFNGMTDTYEYNDVPITVSIDGRYYEFCTSFLFIEEVPKLGTKDWYRYAEWKKMEDEAGKYNL